MPELSTTGSPSDPAPTQLTHLSERGEARMVDVSDKPTTTREATARGFVRLSTECVGLLRSGGVPKGDALAVARIAGIMAAKKTPELIPMCHPLPLSAVEVTVELADEGAALSARVRTSGPTGVEMEAITAVSIACCALLDMIKAVDKLARIEFVEVVAKSGGRSGDWKRGNQ